MKCDICKENTEHLYYNDFEYNKICYGCKESLKQSDNNNIEDSLTDLEYYIDGLYRDSIEEKEHYREMITKEFQNLKQLLNKVSKKE